MAKMANSDCTGGNVSGEFTPAGLFIVCVLRGEVSLQIKLPGDTEWFDVSEVDGTSVERIVHAAGSSCEVTPGIPGSSYRIAPHSSISQAYAWIE